MQEEKTKKNMPAPNQRVIVLCGWCRCLGYVDEHGCWWSAYHDLQLEGVVGWMPIDGKVEIKI